MEDNSFKILTNSDKNIRYVIHASDLHIRTGDLEKSRYHEYSCVFEEWIQRMREFPHLENTVLLLTGDIFHHKGKIEPAGIKLAQKLLSELLEFVDVCMICGNHDYRQDDPNIPDMVEAIFQNYLQEKVHTKHKAYYLDKTGYYQYHNIGFTVVDVRDTLKHYNTSGRHDTLKEFPTKAAYELYPEITYPVAVFHGTILPSRLMNNLQLTDGYELEWFGDYPFVMLGDNHRMQFHTKGNLTWGYPGSLIQQDFGESFMDHGYLIWDLQKGTVSSEYVYNPYGYCTVKLVKEDLHIFRKKTWTPITNIPRFPKNPSFRVFHKQVIPILETFCNKNNITPKCIQCWTNQEKEIEKEVPEDHTMKIEMQQMEELNTTEKWFEYLSKYTDISSIKDWVLHPELLKLPLMEKKLDFLKKYSDRNDKIQKVIDEYRSESTQSQKSNQRVELVNMSWAYLMCYGANNNFHFDSLKNKIALLNGKNAMGKSSFLDILCIALYGEPTKMRNLVTGKKYTDKIIHDQRPVNKIAPFVRLMFRVGKDVYEIFRSFGTQAGKNKEHLILQTNVQICKVTVSFDDVYKEILCEGSTLVDKWISETIGSMDSVLLSTMICQIDLNNFFHLKQDDQKNILDKALRLDTVSIYGRILKESILAHQDILQQIKTAQHTVSNVIGNEEICIHKDVIDSKLQKICEELEKQDQLRDIWKTRIKHYEEVIPDNIEELYQESEINYRSLGKEITQEQIEQNIRLQERWKHLLETYETVKDFEILKDAPKQLEKWQKKLAKFLPKEPKCDVSMQWMDQMLEKYKEWKENNHEEYDLHRIETQYLEAEKNIFSCTKIEKPYRPRYIDIETLEGEVDITPFKSHYQELLANIPKTTRTLEEYNTWRKEYEEWKEMTLTVKDVELEELEQKIQKTQEKIDTYEEKETELKDIREEIETLEKDLESLKDMEFNPDCWACKKNPFQKKKEEYSTHYQELKDYSKQLSTYVRKIGHGDLITKWKEKLSSYKQQVLLYIEYHDKVESYLEEEQFWNKVLTQWEAYTVWQKEVEVVKQKLELYEKQEHNLLWNKYESQEEEHARKKGLYQEAKNKYAIAKKWKEESDYWYEILQEIEKHKDVYQLYTIWCEEKQILQTHLDKYTQSIERSKVEKEMEIVKEEYDRISDAVFIYVEYEKNSSLYYQSKLKELEIEYRKNLHEKETLLAEKTKIETQQEMMQRQKDSMEELMELEKIYTERIASIKKLDTLFIGDKTQSDGYKEWIYKQQVLPLLNREMNQFLQMFENFSFEMTYDKKHFIYMIHDRGNSPTLDKASGYQNFIIGLALRIILARIGAVGQQIKHMFIDEGFTACDSINIEKVPLLLESILKYGDYHSLLIMSHLDSVRECSHINIDIQRKDPFSYIQYGLEYPEIHIYDSKTGSIITKPKRGRPKKNMV